MIKTALNVFNDYYMVPITFKITMAIRYYTCSIVAFTVTFATNFNMVHRLLSCRPG